MARSGRSVPNVEMALAPALVITLGLVTLIAVSGYWLMKPTVSKNPGVAAYQAPAATVLDYGSGDRLARAEVAASKAAEAENGKLGIRPAAGTNSTDGADRSSAVTATPKQNSKAARVQTRQDMPGQSQSRLPRREPAPHSAFARGFFGLF